MRRGASIRQALGWGSASSCSRVICGGCSQKVECLSNLIGSLFINCSTARLNPLDMQGLQGLMRGMGGGRGGPQPDRELNDTAETICVVAGVAENVEARSGGSSDGGHG